MAEHDEETRPFNQCENRTANGRLIVRGMRVLDYNRREGVVGRDTYTLMHELGHCRGDHWFEVTTDTGGWGDFNGDRLLAL